MKNNTNKKNPRSLRITLLWSPEIQPSKILRNSFSKEKIIENRNNRARKKFYCTDDKCAIFAWSLD
jgi:hypothetical protein